MKLSPKFGPSARFLAPVLALAALASTPSTARAAFGLTTATDYYQVDTGAGLVFKVRRTDNGSSTQSPGDIMSLVWNGVEYQDQSRGSQVNSGFDYLYNGVSAVSVSAAVVNTNYIKITVQAGNLTHYYMARNGYPHIYMGDYFTTEPDTLGLCRYILRMQVAKLPNGPTPSDIRNTVSTVESGDVFALSNGQTRSKHYSNMRLKDWSYIGATGTNAGIWVVRDSNEGGSGGPFFRCLLNQCTSTNQEITYIVNYGEAQTEAYRPGILNAYTLVATTGGTPSTSIDTSWFSGMGLSGYLADSGRGRVTGVGINGRDPNYTYTVGFSNSTAQYWTTASASNGYYSCSNMRPGTYTQTIYKNELAVWTGSATVTAGGILQLHTITIGGDPSATTPIWRIGDWDGSPQEFLNGDKLTTMHPSDVRISTWNPSNYIVGTTSASGFPAYMWKDVNNDHIIYFKLNSSQNTVAHTVRIGLTCAYAGGRPKISVNGWSSSLPSPSSQPSSRTLTVGTYRGNNVTYSFTVPASAWQTNTGSWNVLTITAISGTSGTGFLSPGYSIDCVDLL
jgi:rhamnogalacturonan endolyase